MLAFARAAIKTILRTDLSNPDNGVIPVRLKQRLTLPSRTIKLPAEPRTLYISVSEIAQVWLVSSRASPDPKMRLLVPGMLMEVLFNKLLGHSTSGNTSLHFSTISQPGRHACKCRGWLPGFDPCGKVPCWHLHEPKDHHAVLVVHRPRCYAAFQRPTQAHRIKSLSKFRPS